MFSGFRSSSSQEEYTQIQSENSERLRPLSSKGLPDFLNFDELCVETADRILGAVLPAPKVWKHDFSG